MRKLGVILKPFCLIYCLNILGCTSTTQIISPEIRSAQAAHLAKQAGWKDYTLSTSLFTLKAYGSSVLKNKKSLTIYIEGDGFAWISEDRPSENPTPRVPMGLKMAIHDQKNNPVAYLARPCQFVLNDAWRNCRLAYWTDLRFSPEVIQSMNQAVDELKKHYHAQHIVLIGYSGGGTIATLLAARRKDVIQLITVAAILDTDVWVQQNRLTPLYGSLNPANEWKNLVSIPQTHWVGGNDKVVPKAVADAFAKRFPVINKPNIIVVPNFDHACCWSTNWTPTIHYKNN